MTKTLKEQIKEMESMKRASIVPKKEQEVVTFETWFHQRKDKIPTCHLKEIILADFEARGVSLTETVESFDKALSLYGVKL